MYPGRSSVFSGVTRRTLTTRFISNNVFKSNQQRAFPSDTRQYGGGGGAVVLGVVFDSLDAIQISGPSKDFAHRSLRFK